MNRRRIFVTTLLTTMFLACSYARAGKDVAEPRPPGSTFKDCNTCPEMVALPAGSFMMGAPESEVGRQPDEGPVREVTFAAAFAVSRFHVTVEEWSVFAKETKFVLKDGDTRPGRECAAGKPRYPQTSRHPAVCIDFDDANAYIAWLAAKSRQPYRMLSEAQWEYAARAGSTGPFPFPFDDEANYIIHSHANTFGDEDGYSHVAPVGSFPPNAFGMYDMHGNVHEWVIDCLHDSYLGAPTDGSPWLEANNGDCTWRHIRGNDWIEPPIFSRSANRNSRQSFVRGDWIGFRVVRPL